MMTPARPLAALALALALPRPAAASQCQETSFAVQASSADVIFVGHAREIDAELATTFEVERIYKGDAPRRVRIETYRNKYAMLEPHHRYIVLANRDKSSPTTLYVHACSGSRREPWPPDTLKKLGKGKPPSAEPPAPETPPAPPPDEPPTPPPDEPPAPPPEEPPPAPDPASTTPAPDPAPATPTPATHAPTPAPPPTATPRGCTLAASREPALLSLLLAALLPRRRRTTR